MFVPTEVCAALSEFEAASADAAACRVVVGSVKQLRGWLDSVEAAALARLQAMAGPSHSAQTALSAEVSDLTGASSRDAKRKLGLAAGLGGLPHVADALADGRITAEHAGAITSAAKRSDRVGDAITAAQRELLAAAETEPADEFAKRVSRHADAADRAAGEAKAQRHHRNRKVVRFSDDDDMCIIRAQLPVTSGDEVWRVLGHIARRLWRTQHPDAHPDNAPTDTMLQTPSVTYQHLLADALVEMARLAAAGIGSPSGSGEGTGSRTGAGSAIPPHMAPIVHIDLDTYLHGPHAHTVCETGDGTPIPVSELRRLACEAGIIPAVLGSRGEILDLGHRARWFTPAQKRALDAMWGGCFVPTCPVGPEHTHAHHIEPFNPPYGPTDLINGATPCANHHRLIHNGTLVIEQPELGHIVIHHPDGTLTHAYAKHPPPRTNPPPPPHTTPAPQTNDIRAPQSPTDTDSAHAP